MKKLIVLLAALALVGAMVGSAFAEMSAYGSIRFRTYWATTDAGVAGTSDDTNVDWRSGLLSRLGFKFKNGDVGGHWEIDHRSTSPYGALGAGIAGTQDTSWVGSVRVRLAYGYWNFGSGQLLIGQHYPLTDLPAATLNWTSAAMQPYGGAGLALARVYQIRLTFGNLALAFITPADWDTKGAPYVYADKDYILPKIEARYTLPLNNVTLDFAGGYQTYEEENPAGAGSATISSYMAVCRAKAKLGKGFINGSVTYAVNGGTYGMPWNTYDSPTLNAAANDVDDTTTLGFVLCAGMKLSDKVSFAVGYGNLSSDMDVPGDAEDNSQAYYAQVTYKLAPGVTIYPEFVFVDNDDISNTAGVAGIPATDNDQGSTTVFGVFWKIDFK